MAAKKYDAEHPRPMCSKCTRRPVRAKGLCNSCYNIANQYPGAISRRFDRVEADRVDQALDAMATKMLDPTKPIPSLEDIDAIVNGESSVPPQEVDLGLPKEGEPEGVTRTRNWLLGHGVHFRRKIIRGLMGEGVTEPKDIIAVFFRNPDLRSRWIEPLRNPVLMIQNDINYINNETSKGRTLVQRRNLRIERLETQYRQAMGVANDTSARPEIRLKALEAADRYQQVIDHMESTVRQTKPAEGETEPEAETDADGLEHDPDGTPVYRLPKVT